MVNSGFGRNRFSFDFRHLGSANNYSQFEDDGTLVFNGDATVFEDIRVPILFTKNRGISDPDLVQIKDDGSGSTGIYGYAFDEGTEEEVLFMIQIPRTWKIGSDIGVHTHWLPTASTTVADQVSWGLEYVVKEISGTVGDTTIICGDDLSIGNEALTAYKHYATEMGTIDMSGISSGVVAIVGRFFRDATGAGGTDNYASDAIPLCIHFAFEIDKIGSRVSSLI